MISKKKIKYTNQNKYRTKKQRGGFNTAKYAYPFLSQIVYQIHLHVPIPN